MDFNSQKEGNEYIGITSIWRNFLSHKRTIFLFLLLGAVVSIVITRLMPPTYKAEALLRLSLNQPRFTIFQDNVFTPTAQVVNPVASELEILRSRTLLKEVASKKGLYVVSDDKDIPFKFEEQKVANNFDGGRYTLEVFPNGQIRLTDKEGKVYSSRLNQVLGAKWFSFIVTGKPPKTKYITHLRVRGQEQVLRWLKGNLSVRQKGKTDIAIVSMKARNPERAAELANLVCQTYVDFSLSDQRKVARSMREFTEMQLKEVEEELARDEKALMEAKEKAGTYSILTLGNMKGPASEIIKNLATLERNRANAIAAKKEAEARLALLKKELEKGEGMFGEHKEIASLPMLSNNPVVQDLQEKLSLLKSEKARLLQSYTENHPDVQAVTMKINQVEKDLKEAIKEMSKTGPSASDPLYIELMTNYISTEAEVKALDDRIKVFNDLIKKEEARIESLPAKEAEMTRLLRKVETGRSLYTMLLSKLQEAKIQEAKEVGDARIIDAAIPPLHPISPKLPINLFIGLSLGLFMGVFIVMLKESLDESVHSLESLELVTGGIPLGAVPYVKALSKNKGNPERALFVHHSSHTPETESIRTLASRLKFASIGSPFKSFLVTSSVAQEGKSTIAANLAYILAKKGFKTVAVDADLRKPRFSEIFGVKRSPGLSDLILSGASLDSVLRSTKHENLYIIPSGTTVESPGEIISSTEMTSLLTELEDLFDYVIFDTPPLIPFTDALELGTQLDGAILVVKAGHTEKKVIQKGVKLLYIANIRLIGTVLNRIQKTSEPYYYRYNYRYYQENYRKGRKARAGWRLVRSILGKSS